MDSQVARASKRKKGKEVASEPENPSVKSYRTRAPREASPQSINNVNPRLDWKLYLHEEALWNEKANLNLVQEALKKLQILLRPRNPMLYPGLVKEMQDEIEAL